MKTINIIPKNENILPFLIELLSNKEWVSDFRIIENETKEYITQMPNEETLQAIADVEAGKINYIGTIDDYLEWSKNV
ncbi:MAG: hypothetical protein FWG85_00905 [Bacteroidetes bacterium]|nr:hypothetical protein [Bacteroidota bacterium]